MADHHQRQSAPKRAEDGPPMRQTDQPTRRTIEPKPRSAASLRAGKPSTKKWDIKIFYSCRKYFQKGAQNFETGRSVGRNSVRIIGAWPSGGPPPGIPPSFLGKMTTRPPRPIGDFWPASTHPIPNRHVDRPSSRRNACNTGLSAIAATSLVHCWSCTKSPFVQQRSRGDGDGCTSPIETEFVHDGSAIDSVSLESS